MIHFCLSTACEIVTFWLKIHKVLPLPADTDDVDPDGVQLPHLSLRLQLQLPVDEKGYHQQQQQKL